MKNYFFILCATGIILNSCGYQALSPSLGKGQTIWVPTATNDSRWRHLEAELTHQLRESLKTHLDIQINNKNPDLTLSTHLTSVGRNSALSGRQGTVLASKANLLIEWNLKKIDGTNVANGTCTREMEFSPHNREEVHIAFNKLITDIAEQISLEIGNSMQPHAITH